jgi:hypothetical protein
MAAAEPGETQQRGADAQACFRLGDEFQRQLCETRDPLDQSVVADVE